MEFSKENLKRLLIIFVFVILPLILSLFLFQNKEIPLEYDDKTHLLKISEKAIKKPSFISSIRKLFNTPFEFDFYQVYIKDDSHTEDKEVCDTGWNFIINNINYTMEREKSFKIDMIKIDENILWGNETAILKVDYNKISEDNCVISFNWEWYAKPYKSDLWVQRLVFIIAWIGFWFLLLELIKHIKEKKFL